MMSAFSNGLPGNSADFALVEKQTLILNVLVQTDADVGAIRGHKRMWLPAEGLCAPIGCHLFLKSSTTNIRD